MRGSELSGGPQGDEGWFATHLQHLSDMVVVISTDTTVRWANRAVERTLGWAPEAIVGRSFAEFLHPDDLDRAAEVASLVDRDVFTEASVKPALYRIRDAEDRWVTVELNSSLRSSEEGEIIVVCRFTGDLVYGAQLLEAITGGHPVEEQVAITLELGRWRYPEEGYAIVHRTAAGHRVATSPGLPEDLIDLDGTGTVPWRRAVDLARAVEVSDLADPSLRTGIVSDGLAERALAAGFRACLAEPVPDEGFGDPAAIVVWSRNPGPTLTGHRYAVETMVQYLTLVLQQQAHRLRLEQAAFTDQLTGLTSRRRFLQLLDEADAALGDGRHVALYLDLDGFKAVNDDHGHTVGDHVLAVAAGRIAAALPEDALVGRLGGDEFAVLCAPGATLAEAEALVERIHEVLDRPIAHERGRTVVGVTVGLCMGEPGDLAAEVLDRADRALLAARAGRSGRASAGA